MHNICCFFVFFLQTFLCCCKVWGAVCSCKHCISMATQWPRSPNSGHMFPKLFIVSLSWMDNHWLGGQRWDWYCWQHTSLIRVECIPIISDSRWTANSFVLHKGMINQSCVIKHGGVLNFYECANGVIVYSYSSMHCLWCSSCRKPHCQRLSSWAPSTSYAIDRSRNRTSWRNSSKQR